MYTIIYPETRVLQMYAINNFVNIEDHLTAQFVPTIWFNYSWVGQ